MTECSFSNAKNNSIQLEIMEMYTLTIYSSRYSLKAQSMLMSTGSSAANMNTGHQERTQNTSMNIYNTRFTRNTYAKREK